MPAVSHRGRGRRTINEINMVPFIDVMLVLLIIFMVTAPLITPSVIDLPSVGKAARPVQIDTHQTHSQIISALKARDRVAYAYLLSRHLEYGLQFVGPQTGRATRTG